MCVSQHQYTPINPYRDSKGVVKFIYPHQDCKTVKKKRHNIQQTCLNLQLFCLVNLRKNGQPDTPASHTCFTPSCDPKERSAFFCSTSHQDWPIRAIYEVHSAKILIWHVSEPMHMAAVCWPLTDQLLLNSTVMTQPWLRSCAFSVHFQLGRHMGWIKWYLQSTLASC